MQYQLHCNSAIFKLHQVHNFNKIHNKNVLSLNYLDKPMEQLKQGQETMEAKQNPNIKQCSDIGIGNITCILICPHLHIERFVCYQHPLHKR